MRLTSSILLCCAALSATGCFTPFSPFHCGDDSACQAGKRCIDGQCAAADAECASGYRWDDSAGERGAQCAVEPQATDDAGQADMPHFDAAMTDLASPDMPASDMGRSDMQPEPGTCTGCPGNCHDGACVTLLALGYDHACALLSDGTARCWGGNYDGQLGDGTATDRYQPTPVAGLSGAKKLSLGTSFTCALLANLSVRCWGDNDYGQLGIDSTAGSKIPVTVANLSNVTDIATGYTHACAVRGTDTVSCWGANTNGQLGDGTTVQRSAPVPVNNLSGAWQLSLGNFFSCALNTEHTAYCWGYNANGELGNTSNWEQTNYPLFPVGGGAPSIFHIVSGNSHSCALYATGSAQCWGWNQYGQLGDGSMTNRNAPSASIIDVTGLALGYGHTCALHADGSVSCVGENDLGQLGAGNDNAKLDFVTIAGLPKPAVQITGGAKFNCALLADRSVYCWGSNEYGQLGIGSADNAPHTTPTKVGW